MLACRRFWTFPFSEIPFSVGLEAKKQSKIIKIALVTAKVLTRPKDSL